MTSLTIGSLKLKNNLILAPMAGITDVPFRLIAKQSGAGLVCSEMVSSIALVYNDKRTHRMLAISDDEHPVSVQIFGSKPDFMGKAAKIVEDAGADVVDINLGCPVKKVIKTGAGVKLLENEKLMVEVMESVVSSVKIPVTVKIRIGIQDNENIAPEVVKLAEKSGISAVTIHGRSARAQHSGKPNLEAVARAVESSKIPVIGNGGVTDELTASEFLKKTGCAGLMIGRAAIENPEIFKRIEHYLEVNSALPEPSWDERAGFLKNHAQMAAQYYGEKTGLIRLRKLAPFYLKGLPNATKIRDGFNHLTTLSELDELLSHVWRSPHFE